MAPGSNSTKKSSEKKPPMKKTFGPESSSSAENNSPSPSEENEVRKTILPSGYHYGWYTMEQLAEYYDQLIGTSKMILIMLLVMAITMMMMTQKM